MSVQGARVTCCTFPDIVLSLRRFAAMKLFLVLALAQLACSFELTDPEWVAFKVSYRGLTVLEKVRTMGAFDVYFVVFIFTCQCRLVSI